MLVLSRKPGEKIHVGSGITITVVQFQGNRVRIGIDAPADVSICREEILQASELLGASSEEATVNDNDKSEEKLLEEFENSLRLPDPIGAARSPARTGREFFHRTEERLQALMGRGFAAMLMLDLVDSSADAIIGQTLEGLVVSWNGSAGRLYGYTVEEI